MLREFLLMQGAEGCRKELWNLQVSFLHTEISASSVVVCKLQNTCSMCWGTGGLCDCHSSFVLCLGWLHCSTESWCTVERSEFGHPHTAPDQCQASAKGKAAGTHRGVLGPGAVLVSVAFHVCSFNPASEVRTPRNKKK